MDLNDYWQENKRFLVTVGAGLLVFLIGIMVIKSLYEDERKTVSRNVSTNRNALREVRYTTSDLERAADENQALEQAVERLSQSAVFEPRIEFTVQGGSGSAANQYFASVDRVRDELLTLASRNRLRLPGDLGLEALNTTREELIVRHFEALDVIDRVVRMCIESGVGRIDEIQVALDDRLASKQGVGNVERTRVSFTMISDPEPLVRVFALSQSSRFGKPLAILELDAQRARSKEDEVRVDVTFIIVRLHTASPEGVE